MIFGRHINKFYLRYGLFLLIGILALVVVDVAQAEIPEIVGEITDRLAVGTSDPLFLTREVLASLIKKLFLIAGILFVGRFTWRYMIVGTGVRIETDLREELFKKNERMSQKFLHLHKNGDLMTLYTNDIGAIRQCFSSGTLALVDALCLGIVAFTRMFRLNATLALLCLAPLLLVMVADYTVGKVIARKTEINFKAYGHLTDFLTEDFYGIGVIKAFVKEKNERKRFDVENKVNMDTCLDFVQDNVTLNVVFEAIFSSITVIIMAFATYVSYKGSGAFTVGDLVRFVSYYMLLIWPLFALTSLINLRSQGRASLRRLSTLLDAEEEINDNLAVSLSSPLVPSIDVRDLSFRYPDATADALSHVSFTIHEGEMIGIVGATGSGKSTLMDLLVRVWNVPLGTIMIGDRDLMTIPLSDLHRTVAYVTQSAFLFGTSMEANVLFSRTEKRADDVREATKAANEAGFDVSRFAQGIATVIGERGVTISGGQKQRLAIARGLVADAPILILDDSLSAVDTETEAQILSNLASLRAHRTTLIVAHRITTLSSLDRILVIEDGHVTGFAPHEELLKTNAYYAQETRLQALEAEKADQALSEAKR